MPSSGGGTTNTIQKSDPWAGAQPFLTDLMGKAQQTYDNSVGQTQMPSTYAGPGATTQQALQLTANRAMQGSPLIQTANNSLANIMSPSNAPPGQAALKSLLAQYTPGGGGNPYLDSMFNAESKPIIDAVNANAGLAGRTGSGAQQQLLTRNLGDLASQVYGNNFNAEQGLALNAANSLNQADATKNQQAIQASISAPNLAGADYNDLQNLLAVGGAQDQQSQAQLNNLLTQWQYQQQQPWNILSGYAGAISGLGGLGGSSTGSTTQPSQSSLPQLIGTGISMLPFLMSDERLKEDIKRIATAPNGLGIYSFRFKGDNKTQIGLMAQEVQKLHPEAVMQTNDGYLAVNYKRALAA